MADVRDASSGEAIRDTWREDAQPAPPEAHEVSQRERYLAKAASLGQVVIDDAVPGPGH
jgi:hypothetical protein